MNRQTAQQTQQESTPRQRKPLFRHHAAVRPVAEVEHERLSDDSSIGFDLTQVPVQPSAAGGNQDASHPCLVPPRRSPLGGACHSRPPQVQAKLKIGQPGDKYEQEADRVAEQVMRMPEPSVQREGCSSCADKEDEEDKLIQAKPLAGQITPLVQRETEPETEKEEDEDEILQAKSIGDAGNAHAQVTHPLIQNVLSSPGQPLDAATRSFMEPRFGQNFSGVRVHTGGPAAESARAVNARAYTVGRDVVFGEGQYAPGSDEGKRLVAHELGHVLQQTEDRVPFDFKKNVSLTRLYDNRVMRKGFESTISICHRVLTSRKFKVDKGGVRVVLPLKELDKTVPNCQNFKFGVTLTKEVDWGFDDDIGTCEAYTGGIRSFSFSNLSRGTYYLTIWRIFDHPYCCLEGDILVFDENISNDSTGCKRDKDLSVRDIVHGALDIAGFIPVLGAVPDGINAIIYVTEGDWANAGISVVAMIPAIGDGAKATVIAGKEVVKISKRTALKLGEEGLAKAFKEAKAASKIDKAAIKTTKRTAKTASKLEKEVISESLELGKLSPHALVQIFRRGKKVKNVGAVSLKRLRNVVGRAGVSPKNYKLVKVSKEVTGKMEKEAGEAIYGWISRDGAGNLLRDRRGRPIINFTPRGLSSLEDAVKTFGHEVKHVQDFAKGMSQSSEALAELAGEKLWLVVSEMLKKK